MRTLQRPRHERRSSGHVTARRCIVAFILLLSLLAVVGAFLFPSSSWDSTPAAPTRTGQPAESLPPARPPTLVGTASRSTPTSVREAIDRHCDVVRRTVVEKLLPLARTNPVTGHPTVHMAFWGDSLMYFQYLRTTADMTSCLLGSGWVLSESYTVPTPDPVPRGARTIFSSDKHAPHNPQEQITTQFIVTFTKIRYTLEAVDLLMATFLRPQQQVVRRYVARTLLPQMPAVQVLYVGTGSWDTVFPTIAMDGHTPQRSDLLFSPPGQPTWPEKLVAFDEFLQRKFTNPVRSLVTRWRSGQWNNTADVGERSNRTVAVPAWNVAPSRPPNYFFLSHSTLHNCNRGMYVVPPGQLRGTSYAHVQGYPRCTGAMFPVVAILHKHFSLALGEATGGDGVASSSHVQHHRDTTRAMTADPNDCRDVCQLNDGIHIWDEEPLCRERLLLFFWKMF